MKGVLLYLPAPRIWEIWLQAAQTFCLELLPESQNTPSAISLWGSPAFHKKHKIHSLSQEQLFSAPAHPGFLQLGWCSGCSGGVGEGSLFPGVAGPTRKNFWQTPWGCKREGRINELIKSLKLEKPCRVIQSQAGSDSPMDPCFPAAALGFNLIPAFLAFGRICPWPVASCAVPRWGSS